MANRFWVGATGTWNSTAGAKWSTTSGGGSGAAAPTTADDVFFDGASGAGVVTSGAGIACKSVDFNGFGGTFAGSTALTVSDGGLRWGAGMILTYTGALTFASTSGTLYSLTSNAIPWLSNITLNGVGGTWQLGDALNTTGTFTLTNGSFSTNSNNVQTSTMNGSNANTRVLTITSSQWTIAGSGGSAWTTSNTTGLTFTAGGSTLIFNDATASSKTMTTGGLGYDDITFTGAGSGAFIISGASALRDVTVSNNGGANFSFTGTCSGRTFDFTGFTGDWTGGGTLTWTGNVTLSATMTSSTTAVTNFGSTTTQTVTSNGSSFFGVRQNGVGGVTTMADALIARNSLTLMNGTFDTAGFALSIAVTMSLTGTTNLRGIKLNNSLVTLSGAGTLITASGNTTNLTFDAGTSTIIATNSAGANEIVGGGLTLYNLTLLGGGAGSITIRGSNTLNALAVSAGPYNVIFVRAQTSTFGMNGFSAVGSAGNNITVRSDLAGTQAILSVPGTDVICDFITLKDMKGIGGARFFAGRNSTDSGNNSGWRFTNRYRSPVRMAA